MNVVDAVKLQLEMSRLTEKEFIPPKAKQTMLDMEFTIRRLKDEQRRLNEEVRILRKDSARSTDVSKLGELLGKAKEENQRLRFKLNGNHVQRSSVLKRLLWDCLAILNAGSECKLSPSRYLRQVVWEEYKITFVTGREMIQCCHCWKLFSFDEFTVEHLKPKSLGGGDEMPNLRASCKWCNWTRPVEDISHRFTEKVHRQP